MPAPTADDPVVAWLLDEANPSVRYLTLVHLLDRPEEDPEVRRAREMIVEQGPVVRILDRLGEEGHWWDEATIAKYGPQFAAVGYLPKYKGTVWQLILLAELGASAADPRVWRICQHILKHAYRESGLFTFASPRAGREAEEREVLLPCFQGNMLWALTRLGLGDDPRVRRGFEVLLRYQRFDDGDFRTPSTWPYAGRRDRCSGAHSCYAGCSKGLKAVAALPRERWTDEVRAYVQRGSEYFLIHYLYKGSHNPSRPLHPRIGELTFPNFIHSDFLEILTTLLELGVRDPRMEEAVTLLEARRGGDGRWLLEREVSNMHTVLERKGRPSRWITYRARRALRLWREGPRSG